MGWLRQNLLRVPAHSIQKPAERYGPSDFQPRLSPLQSRTPMLRAISMSRLSPPVAALSALRLKATRWWSLAYRDLALPPSCLRGSLPEWMSRSPKGPVKANRR